MFQDNINFKSDNVHKIAWMFIGETSTYHSLFLQKFHDFSDTSMYTAVIYFFNVCAMCFLKHLPCLIDIILIIHVVTLGQPLRTKY